MEKDRTLWYWEYILKIWNDIDSQEELRSGVVAAATFSEAAGLIEDYYGNEIINVETLKPISDIVFDFDSVKEDTDFDFHISKKENVNHLG